MKLETPLTPQELRAMREAAGLTVDQLGAFLDRSAMTVRRWESGESPIDRMATIAIKALLSPLLEP